MRKFRSSVLLPLTFLSLVFATTFANARTCRGLFFGEPQDTPAAIQARMTKASSVLVDAQLWSPNQSFSPDQVRQINLAHWHGFGEPGKFWYPASVGNYTVPQNATKLRMLIRGNAFTIPQALALANAGVVGALPPIEVRPPYLYDAGEPHLYSVGGIGSAAEYEGKSFNELIALGAPHEYIHKAYQTEKENYETLIRLQSGSAPEYHLLALQSRWLEYSKVTIHGTLPVQRTVPAEGVSSTPPGPDMILNPHGQWMSKRLDVP